VGLVVEQLPVAIPIVVLDMGQEQTILEAIIIISDVMQDYINKVGKEFFLAWQLRHHQFQLLSPVLHVISGGLIFFSI
jgi:hypothetical protein